MSMSKYWPQGRGQADERTLVATNPAEYGYQRVVGSTDARQFISRRLFPHTLSKHRHERFSQLVPHVAWLDTHTYTVEKARRTGFGASSSNGRSESGL